MKKREGNAKIHHRVKLGFFLLISFVVFALAAIIFAPFVILLATAMVAAVVVTPFHRWLTKKSNHHRRLTAFLVVICTFILVVLPLTIGAVFLAQEITSLVAESSSSGGLFQSRIQTNPVFQRLPDDAQRAVSQVDVDFLIRTVSRYFAENVSEILASTTKYMVLTLLFFFSLYYFLTERDYLYKKFLALSPLSNTIDTSLVRRLITTIRAVVVGNVLVGFLQGILSGIGFLIFGLPSAAIWGLVAVFAAQLPTFGTALVTMPAVLYLYLTGNIGGAIGLFIWSVFLVGGIDNYLKPKLVEGKTKMHVLPVLLSMLGGLEAFGPVGFILGPAILAAALAFFDMYEAGVLEGNVKL